MMIYISGALKGSSDLSSARSLYERAAKTIVALGHSAYLPHTETDPTDDRGLSEAEVYLIDIRKIRSADGVVAFLNEPSLGVGAEVATCVHESIPLLGLYHSSAEVSRFALGYMASNGSRVLRYRDCIELDQALKDFVHMLQSLTAESCSYR